MSHCYQKFRNTTYFYSYFCRYHAREYDQALDVIRQIDLLPLNVVPGSSQREFIQQKVMVSHKMKL